MPSFRHKPAHPLEYTLGQLRHCYKILMNAQSFGDYGIAEGFIAPAIVDLQKVIDEYKSKDDAPIV
jgi:hypothetical protein